MRNLIIKLGRPAVIALITLVSVIGSVLVSIPVLEISGRGVDLEGIFITMSIAAIVAPSVCWFLIGLLLEVYRLEEVQRKLITYDMLTGLLTRRAFFENCEAILKIIERNRQSLALAYIDIDDFKKINDTYGHAGGDEVLKSFAAGLHEYIRDNDLVGRIGGEEFAIALINTDLKDSIHVFEKIRLTSEANVVNFSNETLQYTVSMGVTLYDKNNSVDLEHLLRQSDHALYEAKNSGKNCIVQYATNEPR